MQRRALFQLLAASGLVLVPGLAEAAREAPRKDRGRPTVVVDRITLPEGLAGERSLRRWLNRSLLRAARRADWGAGRGNTIMLRFTVTELVAEVHDDVLRVRCTALGELPRGKKARSSLSFGGAPHQRKKLIEQVTELVARGVITRLAELERTRRGERPLAVRVPIT